MQFHLAFLALAENPPKHQWHRNQLLTTATSAIFLQSKWFQHPAPWHFEETSKLNYIFKLYPSFTRSIFPFHLDSAACVIQTSENQPDGSLNLLGGPARGKNMVLG